VCVSVTCGPVVSSSDPVGLCSSDVVRPWAERRCTTQPVRHPGRRPPSAGRGPRAGWSRGHLVRVWGELDLIIAPALADCLAGPLAHLNLSSPLSATPSAA
jgi:hypothetical protein